jgi:hypothetical protein
MSAELNKVIEYMAPVWSRAVDFVLERAWIEYLALILLLIVPFKQGDTIMSRTVFLIATTVVLLGMKHVIVPFAKGQVMMRERSKDPNAEKLMQMQQMDRMKKQEEPIRTPPGQ